MFKPVASVLNDVASLSTGITGTALNAVLLVDDSLLLARDQVAIWRLSKANEMKALGLEPTNSASAIKITAPQG